MADTYTGKSNEAECYKFFTGVMNLNNAAASGLLANIYAESNFNTGASGDSGTSYGLTQWHKERFTKLKNYCNKNGYDYSSLKGQLYYLKYELETGEGITNGKKLLYTFKNLLNSPQGAYTAAYEFCVQYERPKGGSTTAKKRGDSARNNFWPIYSGQKPTGTFGEDYGNAIVKEAKKYIGKKYSSSIKPPDAFSSENLVPYVYKNVLGIDLPDTALQQYTETNGTWDSVPQVSDIKAGDVVFFNGETRSSKSIVYSGIATGSNNKFICCTSTSVVENDLTQSPWNTKYEGAIRLNNEYVTSSGLISGDVSQSPIDAITGLAGELPLSNINQYYEILEETIKGYENALNLITNGRDSYSSLVNLKTGEEFRFYLPKSTSENVPVSWSSPGNILGRSVPVLGYDGTGARTVVVELDLFAGTQYRPGITRDDKDPVGTLHKDISFLKSLEYPDYSTSIVSPPPIVLLSLGSSLKIRGVMSNLSIVHNEPYDLRNRAMYVKVSFTITQVSDDPPGVSDIRNFTNRSY